MTFGSVLVNPIEEYSYAKLTEYENNVKRELLRRAIRSQPGTSELDWTIREIFPGSANTSSTLVYDIEYANEITSGAVSWGIAAATMAAASTLESAFLATGGTYSGKVPKNKFIAIYGVYDLSPRGSTAAGAATTPVPTGTLTGVRLTRGSSALSYWNTDKMYLNNVPMLIADEPVFWNEEEKFKIEFQGTIASIDYYNGLRGFICEHKSEYFGPDEDMLTFVHGNNGFGKIIPGGTKPIQELSADYLVDLRNRIKEQLIVIAERTGIGKRSELNVREVVFGDQGNAANFVDIDVKTAQVSAAQYLSEDAADITANAMSSILQVTKLPSNKAIAIYGFYDRTAVPDLVALSCDSGGLKKMATHVEHCYIYDGIPQGIFTYPVFYKPNETIDVKMCFKTKVDKFVGLHAMIVEHWGDIVSEF